MRRAGRQAGRPCIRLPIYDPLFHPLRFYYATVQSPGGEGGSPPDRKLQGIIRFVNRATATAAGGDGGRDTKEIKGCHSSPLLCATTRRSASYPGKSESPLGIYC